jgi:FlaA1/EpsC-like NDP-sugar epimerase
VKIVDLARDLIRLSGLVPDDDIEIVFSGIRPGEKLFEELSVTGENASKTRHPKIFVGTFKPYDWETVERGYARLHECTDGGDTGRIHAAFSDLVPEFHSSSTPRPPLAAPPPADDTVGAAIAADDAMLGDDRASVPAV